MTIFQENMQIDYRCQECGGHVIGEYNEHVYCPLHPSETIISLVVNPAAELGRKGGRAGKGKVSPHSRDNGKLGGRPRAAANYCSVCEKPLTKEQRAKGFKTCDAGLPEEEQVCTKFVRDCEEADRLERAYGVPIDQPLLELNDNSTPEQKRVFKRQIT